MPESTYTNRKRELRTIKKLENGEVHFSDSMCTYPSENVYKALREGMDIVLETRNFSRIVGWYADGAWIERKSDQELDEEHRAYIEARDREYKEQYEAEKEDLRRRTDELRPEFKARLDYFLSENDSFAWQGMGWHYELVILEMAEIWLKHDALESVELHEYANAHGVSGTQWETGLFFARSYREGHRVFHPQPEKEATRG